MTTYTAIKQQLNLHKAIPFTNLKKITIYKNIECHFCTIKMLYNKDVCSIKSDNGDVFGGRKRCKDAKGIIIQEAVDRPGQEDKDTPNLYDAGVLCGSPFFFPQLNALLRRSGMTCKNTRLLSQLSRVSPTMLFLGLGPREVPFINAPIILVVTRYSPRSRALIEILATSAGD